MKLGTSLTLAIFSFTVGYMVRAKQFPLPPEQITFISQAPKPLPKSDVVAGRGPQSVNDFQQEASLIKPIRETINGVDIVQAMLVKDMAKVFAANKIYEQAWRRQFVESHAKAAMGEEVSKLESALVGSLPINKGENEKIYRGHTTLTVDGEEVTIEVVMSMQLQTWTSVSGDQETKTQKPCFRLDGFIATDKIVERLFFDQAQTCSQNYYERMDQAFIGVDNYRRKTGSLVNMLLFPLNPKDGLPLEYLSANSADWQKDGQWVWQEAGPDSLSNMQNAMVTLAVSAGLDPEPLWIVE